MRLVSFAGLLASAALLVGAGDAGRGGPTIAGARLDAPRPGPGSKALAAVARCLPRGDRACFDGPLQGAELAVRALELRLVTTAPAERSAAFASWSKRLRKEGPRAARAFLPPALGECTVPIAAARLGRCDDTGPVAPPAPPPGNLVDGFWAALSGLRIDLLSHVTGRRARRLVCGPVDVGGRVQIGEAVVVLADRPGGPAALVDVRCRDLFDPEAAAAQDPKLPPATAATTRLPRALAAALRCLDEGGAGCLDEVAPFSTARARAFVARLADHRDRARALADAGRDARLPPVERARSISTLLSERCDLAALGDEETCRAGREVPVGPEPTLPRDLTPAERAQARALLALMRGGREDGRPKAREVVCRDARATVVYVDPGGGAPPELLDLRCPK